MCWKEVIRACWSISTEPRRGKHGRQKSAGAEPQRGPEGLRISTLSHAEVLGLVQPSDGSVRWMTHALAVGFPGTLTTDGVGTPCTLLGIQVAETG